jgi:hypothetical protein
MIEVPEVVVDAVTSPVLSTVATEELLLLQEPPAVASFKFVVVPIHKVVVPVIRLMAGKAFTVTGEVKLFVQLFPFGAVV